MCSPKTPKSQSLLTHADARVWLIERAQCPPQFLGKWSGATPYFRAAGVRCNLHSHNRECPWGWIDLVLAGCTSLTKRELNEFFHAR